jgi:uncharacterized membrane protein
MTGHTAKWVTPILATVGLTIAGYLTWSHYEHDVLVCGLGDCSTVQSSNYSVVAGIPIAILGLLMFGTVLTLSLLRIARPALSDIAGAVIVFLTLTSVLYYAYLTYIEIWVLEAVCQWCVLSSIVTIGILAFELWTFWRSESVVDH